MKHNNKVNIWELITQELYLLSYYSVFPPPISLHCTFPPTNSYYYPDFYVYFCLTYFIPLLHMYACLNNSLVLPIFELCKNDVLYIVFWDLLFQIFNITFLIYRKDLRSIDSRELQFTNLTACYYSIMWMYHNVFLPI